MAPHGAAGRDGDARPALWHGLRLGSTSIIRPVRRSRGSRSLDHGGGWLCRQQGAVADYARILAARGFTVVAVGYALAPGAIYPTPVSR